MCKAAVGCVVCRQCLAVVDGSRNASRRNGEQQPARRISDGVTSTAHIVTMTCILTGIRTYNIVSCLLYGEGASSLLKVGKATVSAPGVTIASP